MDKDPSHINCDLYPGPNIDVVFDACKPWPFRDNSIGMVGASHVFEHLPDPWTFMKEAHRVLVPSPFANLVMRLPYGPGIGGMSDLTHVRPYLPFSFASFQPGYNERVANPQHDAWKWPFSVISIYLQVNTRLKWLLWPVLRHWGVFVLDFLWDGYYEMTVGMRAMKDPTEIERWKATDDPSMVPIAKYMWEHDYQGRKLEDGEKPRYKFFGPGAKQMQAQVI